MSVGAFSSEQIVTSYEVVFDPLVRAAHRACLELGRMTGEDSRPTVLQCLGFAKLYGISGPEFAAFFGYLSYRDTSRTVWVDALAGNISSLIARQRATREQAIAFGFLCAFRDTVRPELSN